jgi:hypothetical protein
MPYIYAKIYPKVLLGYEEDKITYRTFDSLDEYILFVNFELPGLMQDEGMYDVKRSPVNLSTISTVRTSGCW